ncbi:glycosyltransferase family 4 protein [Cupriavidus basilensis]
MNDLSILKLNHSDIFGGAARAAYRIQGALQAAGVDVRMQVVKKHSDDWVVSSRPGILPRIRGIAGGAVGELTSRLLGPKDSTLRSPAILPSGIVRSINRSSVDIVHLHWICGEMLSIEELGRINKPVVWTIHDMWAFCGAEHYTSELRWQNGYAKVPRQAGGSAIDWDRWVWQRKRRAWKAPFHIVSPSHWLATCVRDSTLMGEWPVTVIPNALDLETWQPVDQRVARGLLKLPLEKKIVVFGAIGGGRDERKGIDLLLQALNILDVGTDEIELVVFGQSQPKEPVKLKYKTHYLGHVHDDLTLRCIYSAGDAMVIPSRQENLPNTGLESMACGTPVVSFNIGGLPDIVCHQRNGWLAKPFDVDDLARGIKWVIEDEARSNVLRMAAEEKAKEYSYSNIAQRYGALYRSILNQGTQESNTLQGDLMAPAS